uniref:Reverse transcriptase Ty1/copia-type domain-containing protein n=1 Tax=Cannabis sativa TaxID=3483 RepID=A0A803PQ81_CANSA
MGSKKPLLQGTLKDAIYGLNQAPRARYDKFKTALESWGFPNSVSDSSLFHAHIDNQLLIVLVYVDDILITGANPRSIQQIITNLHNQFALKILRPVNILSWI